MSAYDQPDHGFSCRCDECAGDDPEAHGSPYADHVRQANERRESAERGLCLACGRYWRGVHLAHLLCSCAEPKGVPPYCYDHNCKEPCFVCEGRKAGVNPYSVAWMVRSAQR